MNLELLKKRHSVRTFTGRIIDLDLRRKLSAEVDAVNNEGQLSFKLCFDEPEAFGDSKLAHYGKFSGVTNYVCLAAPKERDAAFRVGYYGQRVLLAAQALGLNTCWVGMTFSRSNVDAELERGEKIYAVIAMGYGTTQGKEHRVKAPEKISRDYATAPEWFRRGVDAALLAPTAMNQQKFRLRYLGDKRVKISTQLGFYVDIDMGIARRHFEIGAAPVQVEWV
jgi:hypothetical protein